MGCGGGGGWDVEVRSDSQVDPAPWLTLSGLLQRPQVTLFPIKQRAKGGKTHRTGPSYLGRAAIIQLKL